MTGVYGIRRIARRPPIWLQDMIPLCSYSGSGRDVDYSLRIGGDERIRTSIADNVVRRHVRDRPIVLEWRFRSTPTAKRKECLQLDNERHSGIPGRRRLRRPFGRWYALPLWQPQRVKRAPKISTSCNEGCAAKHSWQLLYPNVKWSVPVTESNPLFATLPHPADMRLINISIDSATRGRNITVQYCQEDSPKIFTGLAILET